jgi:hypothetical protein
VKGTAMHSKTKLIIISLFLLSFSDPLYAYLDPGTGSLIIQALIAGIVGVLYVIKIYWQKIKSLFIKESDKTNDIKE